ncbi:hypothetical protein OOU_Y34scaffold00712g12 [Pyricularia oryzae Y34]|uniref:Uncharacterized protein n=2 Tax=Pyricularia oryzae TaxID=318829 RepID=A0AA97NS97_PYRO3|nr:hypothetical protein OOU_Y34scaffold00712g12 [Pyricularia oryzae Y34]
MVMQVSSGERCGSNLVGGEVQV